jgi:hypothetical protein
VAKAGFSLFLRSQADLKSSSSGSIESDERNASDSGREMPGGGGGVGKGGISGMSISSDEEGCGGGGIDKPGGIGGSGRSS